MSSEQDKTPAEILSELETRLAARTIAVKGPDAETQRKITDATNDLEFLALVEKFNALGKQDQKYAIVDITEHGQGFVVVALGPKVELHRKMINHAAKGDDAQWSVKSSEVTRESVVHPTLDLYDKLISEVPTVADICFMAVQDLWGSRAKIRRGK